MSFFGLFKKESNLNEKPKPKKKAKHKSINELQLVQGIVEKFVKADSDFKGKYEIRVKEEYAQQIPLTNVQKPYKSPVIFVKHKKTNNMFILSFFGNYINVSYVEDGKVIPSDEEGTKNYFSESFGLDLLNLVNKDGIEEGYVYDNKLLLLEPISIVSQYSNLSLNFTISDDFLLTLIIKNEHNHILEYVEYSLINTPN